MTTTKPPNQFDAPIGSGHSRLWSTGIVIDIQDPAQKKGESAHNIQVRLIGEQQQGISPTNADVPDSQCQWMPCTRSSDTTGSQGAGGTPQYMAGDQVRVAQYTRDEFEVTGSTPKSKMGPGQTYNDRTTDPSSTKSFKNSQRGKPWGDGSWGAKKGGSPISTTEWLNVSSTAEAFELRKGGVNYEEPDDFEATKTTMERPEEYDKKPKMKTIGMA